MTREPSGVNSPEPGLVASSGCWSRRVNLRVMDELGCPGAIPQTQAWCEGSGQPWACPKTCVRVSIRGGLHPELCSLAKGPQGTAGSWDLPGSLDISAGTVTARLGCWKDKHAVLFILALYPLDLETGSSPWPQVS